MISAAKPATVQKALTKPGILAPFTGNAREDTPGAKVLGYVLLAVQLALILFLVERFRLEDYRFRVIVRLAVGGFVLHHFLPRRLKLPFFVTLSMGGIAYGLGLEQGGWNFTKTVQRAATLFGVGGVLIGIVRLRFTFVVRMALMAAVVAVLALFRAGFARIEPLDAIWPILGGMFMFRLMLYVYDTEHESQKHSLWHALGYFFLLPNLWLFVFPVIDFKAFIKGHLSQNALSNYQIGAFWMARGVFQILLWRIIYYQVYIDPSHVNGGAEVAQYLLSNVALYLRVSGQFHFVIGLLHLFGFRLPETNKRYFFASSFTDYWRRVNIYWKDFIMKLFYYPMVVRFKSLGPTRSMIAATAIAFVATWFLHSYQWFWLRGSFPVEAKEAAFWALLGLLVCWNSYREFTRGRKRTLGNKQKSVQELLWVGAKTATTFGIITVLWSIWSCDTLTQWIDLWKQASLSTAAYLSAAMLVIGTSAVLVEGNVFSRGKSSRLNAAPEQLSPFPWRTAAVTVLTPAALFIVLSSSHVTKYFHLEAEAAARSLFKNTPNKSDEEFMVRGYYESLMDTNRYAALVSTDANNEPADWKRLNDTDAVRPVVDFRVRELIPSKATLVNGHIISVNSAGMRDDEYTLVKPAGTYRIALLGSSLVMGWNVDRQDMFEHLIEKRFRENGQPVELLNFAANEYAPLSMLDALRKKTLPFKPDALLLVSHPEDPHRTTRMLVNGLKAGAMLHPELQAIIADTGVTSKTVQSRAERALTPKVLDILSWSYQAIVKECKANGITPVWIYMPGVLHRERSASDDRLIELARAAGFSIITLFDMYGDIERSALMVAPWDAHPNARANNIIAERLVDELRRNPEIGPRITSKAIAKEQ